MLGLGNETLIVNAGSSSVKFRLYRGAEEVIGGVVDGISRSDGSVWVQLAGMSGKLVKQRVQSYEDAGKLIIEIVRSVSHLDSVGKVVHRVVHGGEYDGPEVVSASVFRTLESFIPLAPLHQPVALSLIRFFAHSTKAKQIACFDTSFHRTMPRVAREYPLPRKVTERFGLKRYGFHGLSHASLFHQAEDFSGKRFENVVTCQLGNGVSICAIKDGKSVDTTMGFTPLEGVMMGTRSGSIDPAVVAFLCGRGKMSPSSVLHMLEHDSGFKGVAGDSDVRVVRARAARGDKAAKLALELFAYQIRKQIGAYFVALTGLDALVLGGGISKNTLMRRIILEDLDFMGIQISDKVGESTGQIGKGKVKVWVLESDEEGYMFRITRGIK